MILWLLLGLAFLHVLLPEVVEVLKNRKEVR